MLRKLLADKKLITRFILILCAIFALSVYIYGVREKDNIRENLGITACEITGVHSGYRGGIQMKYLFSYNGKNYTGETKYFISFAYADRFLGYTFPVAFDKSNPTQNIILLLPHDFEKFNLPYPDSLEWVRSLKDKSL